MKGRAMCFAKWPASCGIQRAENNTMSQSSAEVVTTIVTVYTLIGVAFAVVFVMFGVGRVDAAARHAPWTFRSLILPGVTVFWPLLLVRWISGSVAPPIEVNPHRARARSRR
jgi:hypothetical protein